jgi:hypothetical protein
MESRFYHGQGIYIERLATELERMFLMQGFQVQHFGNNDQMTVQMKKGDTFTAIIGMQQALTVAIQRAPDGVLAMIGQQKWADKAVIGTIGLVILWPLMFTAGAGAIQQARLATQAANSLDMLVRQQNPNVQVGPIPPGMMPPYQQPGAPPPYTQPPYAQPWPPQYQGTPQPTPPPSNKVVCANCQAPNDVDDSYCMSCGHALTSPESQKTHCPTCGAETKPNAAFCTQCGTSLSQAEERT